MGELMAPQRGSHDPAPASSNVAWWTVLPLQVFNGKSGFFWKQERGDRQRRHGDPQILTCQGRYLGTYQWGHPLEEVDTLPVIDVVRLPALGGDPGRGTVRHTPTVRPPLAQMASRSRPDSFVLLSSPGNRPGQASLTSRSATWARCVPLMESGKWEDNNGASPWAAVQMERDSTMLSLWRRSLRNQQHRPHRVISRS